jgi:DNA-binding XRE family transcriptional regulator
MTISEIVKAIRKELDISQETLAHERTKRKLYNG